MAKFMLILQGSSTENDQEIDHISKWNMRKCKKKKQC